MPVKGALLKTKAEDLAIKLGRKEFKATDGLSASQKNLVASKT